MIRGFDKNLILGTFFHFFVLCFLMTSFLDYFEYVVFFRVFLPEQFFENYFLLSTNYDKFLAQFRR